MTHASRVALREYMQFQVEIQRVEQELREIAVRSFAARYPPSASSNGGNLVYPPNKVFRVATVEQMEACIFLREFGVWNGPVIIIVDDEDDEEGQYEDEVAQYEDEEGQIFELEEGKYDLPLMRELAEKNNIAYEEAPFETIAGRNLLLPTQYEFYFDEVYPMLERKMRLLKHTTVAVAMASEMHLLAQLKGLYNWHFVVTIDANADPVEKPIIRLIARENKIGVSRA